MLNVNIIFNLYRQIVKFFCILCLKLLEKSIFKLKCFILYLVYCNMFLYEFVFSYKPKNQKIFTIFLVINMTKYKNPLHILFNNC